MLVVYPPSVRVIKSPGMTTVRAAETVCVSMPGLAAQARFLRVGGALVEYARRNEHTPEN